MESRIGAVEDRLSSAFSAKLPSSASYITGRRMVRFFPSGGNSYSPSGVRVIRIVLTGDGMLDPASASLGFKLKNDSFVNGDANTSLHLLNFSTCLFSRCRIICSGVVVSDEDSYGRITHMISQLGNKHARENLAHQMGERGRVVGAEETFVMPMYAPIFNQQKNLPLQLMNCVIELTLCDQAADCMLKTADLPSGVTAQSSSWHLEEVQLHADILSLDQSLENSMVNSVQNGKSLNIPFTSIFTSRHTITTPSYHIMTNRSLTRLKSLFVTYMHDGDKEAFDLRYPGLSDSQFSDTQIQLGSLRFPESACSSCAESWYRLMETTGGRHSTLATSAIELADYKQNSYIFGLNFEKVIMDTPDSTNWSGQSLKQGDTVTVKVNQVNSNITTAFFHYLFDGVISITDQGCEVYE
jgi:hypothetical protein